MIAKDELDKAIEIARKYDVGELYLIGSSLYKESNEVNDYDFAVRNVPAGNFFKFYGELFRVMSKNVDLIDLSGKMTKFKSIILKEGKLIYAKTSALNNTVKQNLKILIHAYSFNLRWEDMKPLVDGLQDTLNRFKSEISHYIDAHG